MKALRSFIVLRTVVLLRSGIASQWYCPADSGIALTRSFIRLMASDIASQCYYASHSCIVLRTVMGRGEKHTPKAQGIKKEAVH